MHRVHKFQSSVGMISPSLMENPSTNVSVEQIIPPVSVANASGECLFTLFWSYFAFVSQYKIFFFSTNTDLNAWETCKESVDSDENAACTSLLSNMDSDSLNEASYESLADDSNPFFIRIDCKICSGNEMGKCALNTIPTCICE